MTRRTFNLQMLQDYAKERGGKLISKEFINSTTFCIWACKNGHKWKATPLEVLGKKNGKGSWCSKCPKITTSMMTLESIENLKL